MANIETVVIETENGPVVINKCDFKEGGHKLQSDSEKRTYKPRQKRDEK